MAAQENCSELQYESNTGVKNSPTLFNIFLERIMCEVLDDHEGSVSIGGRLITNFRFTDDIVVNAEEKEEAGVLVDRLDTTTRRYKMEIGPDNTKRDQDKRSEARSSGELGATSSKEGTKPRFFPG